MFFSVSLIAIFIAVFIICIVTTISCKSRLGSYSLAIPCWLMLLWYFKAPLDFIVAAKSFTEFRYENELFPIFMDDTYLLSMLLYLVFFLSYILVIVYYQGFAKNISPRDRYNLQRIELGEVFHLAAIFFAICYLGAGIYLFKQALSIGMSAYNYSRHEIGSLKSILNLISWLTVLFAVLGLINTKGKLKALYVVLISIAFLTSLVLGNRHILISAVIFYFIVTSDRVPFSIGSLLKYMIGALIFFTMIMSIYVLRETQADSFNEADWGKAASSSLALTSSSEFVYSHLSMYGILKKEIEPYWGGSFIFLSSSYLPKVVNENRELDIYQYYINKAIDNPYKGFSISNPAGWYLNLGVIGVPLGGAILALITIFLHHNAYFSRYGLWGTYFWLLLFCIFLSDSVGYLRSGGPEPLRAVLMIKSLVPTIVIIFCLKLRLFKRNKVP